MGTDLSSQSGATGESGRPSEAQSLAELLAQATRLAEHLLASILPEREEEFRVGERRERGEPVLSVDDDHRRGGHDEIELARAGAAAERRFALGPQEDLKEIVG